eukprot:8499762-Pyramimonas_sp.AAC.1
MKYSSEKHDAYFIRSSNGHSCPGISVGLSCRADDTSKKRGKQFVHGCSRLPGDNRIQSGLRVDSEVLVT